MAKETKPERAARLTTTAKVASERADKHDTYKDHEQAAKVHTKAAEAHGATGNRESQNEHRGKAANHTERAGQLRDAHGRYMGK